MFRKRWIIAVSGIFLFTAVWNYPSTYRIAINGSIFEKRTPLYAKACGFLYRDWMYKDIVREAIKGQTNEVKKALAVFDWIEKNVRSGIPEGFMAVDDHPLNIIIRQYGTKGQIEDIFTILCSYAGMKAGVKKCYNHAGNKHIPLSFVLADGRWLIFDAARHKYFLNRNRDVGSVEDHYNGDLIMTEEERTYYQEFLDDSRGMNANSFIRTEGQMPLKRIPVQINKFLQKSLLKAPRNHNKMYL